MEIRIDPWKLRPWQPGDVDALVKYANNYAIWRNLPDTFPHPYTETDAREWSQRPNQGEPLTNLAIATADEAIGSIGLTLQDDVHFRSGEVGYWLGEPFWGQGIATRALRTFSEYAFANFDLVRLYAIVFEWNPASARVLEKAGFTSKRGCETAPTRPAALSTNSCTHW